MESLLNIVKSSYQIVAILSFLDGKFYANKNFASNNDIEM